MTKHLQVVTQRKHALRRSRSALDDAITAAVNAGIPKSRVAEAAGISRPTLYAILNQTERQT